MTKSRPAFRSAVALSVVAGLIGCGGSTPAGKRESESSGGGVGQDGSRGAEGPFGPGGHGAVGGHSGDEPGSSGGARGGAFGEDGGASSSAGGGGAGSGGSGTGTPPDPGTIDCRTEGDGKTTLVFVNGCEASVEFRGSDIDGGTIPKGGFACVDIGTDVEPISSKRYYGFIGQDPGGEHHTLAEFTFNTDFYDFDWYNISHVDAHNLPMQIVPVGRDDCEPVTCEESWLESCPDIGKLTNEAGEVISCVSPDRDNSQSEVALFFEACDDAYAWSGDDQEGDDPSPMHACAGEDWDIVFCPGAE